MWPGKLINTQTQRVFCWLKNDNSFEKESTSSGRRELGPSTAELIKCVEFFEKYGCQECANFLVDLLAAPKTERDQLLMYSSSVFWKSVLAHALAAEASELSKPAPTQLDAIAINRILLKIANISRRAHAPYGAEVKAWLSVFRRGLE